MPAASDIVPALVLQWLTQYGKSDLPPGGSLAPGDPLTRIDLDNPDAIGALAPQISAYLESKGFPNNLTDNDLRNCTKVGCIQGQALHAVLDMQSPSVIREASTFLSSNALPAGAGRSSEHLKTLKTNFKGRSVARKLLAAKRKKKRTA
jgi:hypothetical protein